jgi:hypothetical protein
MKLTIEIPDADLPRVKLFITNMIGFELEFAPEPEKEMLRFLNAVDQAISREEVLK